MPPARRHSDGDIEALIRSRRDERDNATDEASIIVTSLEQFRRPGSCWQIASNVRAACWLVQLTDN
jgi:hypothetical protein